MSAYRESGRELGRVITEHRWTQSPAMIVVGLAMLIAPFLILLLPTGDDWSVLSYVGLIAMFTLLPLAGISLLIDARRFRSNVVRLHEDALFHRWKGVVTIARFEDIASIESKLERATQDGAMGVARPIHLVLLMNGTTLRITEGLGDAEVLMEALRVRVRPLLLERTRLKES